MTEKKLLSFHASVVKDINEQLVLKLIQKHQVISSTDLVKITGMRPSTIFNILKFFRQNLLLHFTAKAIQQKKVERNRISGR
jgi:transcription initiation factor IIE alpha subunit